MTSVNQHDEVMSDEGASMATDSGRGPSDEGDPGGHRITSSWTGDRPTGQQYPQTLSRCLQFNISKYIIITIS